MFYMWLQGYGNNEVRFIARSYKNKFKIISDINPYPEIINDVTNILNKDNISGFSNITVNKHKYVYYLYRIKEKSKRMRNE